MYFWRTHATNCVSQSKGEIYSYLGIPTVAIITMTCFYSTIQHNSIAKCQYNCTRNVLWCQVHSSHTHANHKTSSNYNNSKQTSPGKTSFINKYMRNPTDIKLCISHKNCILPLHYSSSGGASHRRKMAWVQNVLQVEMEWSKQSHISDVVSVFVVYELHRVSTGAVSHYPDSVAHMQRFMGHRISIFYIFWQAKNNVTQLPLKPCPFHLPL